MPSARVARDGRCVLGAGLPPLRPSPRSGGLASLLGSCIVMRALPRPLVAVVAAAPPWVFLLLSSWPVSRAHSLACCVKWAVSLRRSACAKRKVPGPLVDCDRWHPARAPHLIHRGLRPRLSFLVVVRGRVKIFGHRPAPFRVSHKKRGRGAWLLSLASQWSSFDEVLAAMGVVHTPLGTRRASLVSWPGALCSVPSSPSLRSSWRALACLTIRGWRARSLRPPGASSARSATRLEPSRGAWRCSIAVGLDRRHRVERVRARAHVRERASAWVADEGAPGRRVAAPPHATRRQAPGASHL